MVYRHRAGGSAHDQQVIGSGRKEQVAHSLTTVIKPVPDTRRSCTAACEIARTDQALKIENARGTTGDTTLVGS